MKKLIPFILFCCLILSKVYSQHYEGRICKNYTNLFLEESSISGIVKDEKGNLMPFVNVTLLKRGRVIEEITTSFDGEYLLEPLLSGMYNLRISFVGYQTKKISQINLEREKLVVNVIITKGIDLPIIECFGPPFPVFDKDQMTSSRTYSRQDIEHMPF